MNILYLSVKSLRLDSCAISARMSRIAIAPLFAGWRKQTTIDGWVEASDIEHGACCGLCTVGEVVIIMVMVILKRGDECEA